MRMFRSRRLSLVREMTADDWHEVAVLYRAFQDSIGAIVRRARLRAREPKP